MPRSLDQFCDELWGIIHDAYMDPLLYGPSAIELEVRLETLHWVIAHAGNRLEEFYAMREKLVPDAPEGLTACVVRAAGEKNPDADTAALLDDVIAAWRKLSDELQPLAAKE